MSTEEFPFDQIPPLSLVVSNVIQFDPDDPDASIERLYQIIAPDKGISAELLKIANSALYGRSGRVKSLKDSITLLGVKTVKNIVILLTTRAMNGRLNRPIFNGYLREWPILSALVALDLCNPLRTRALREDAFLAGLLHRIGMTVIGLNRPEKYAALLESFEASGGRGPGLSELERQTFGIDHLQVAARVFEMWKLPADLRQMVLSHEFPAAAVGEQSDIVRIAALSGLMARELIGLALTPVERELILKIQEHYAAPPEMMAAFNAEYYANLKEHPFLQEVGAG